MNDKSINNAISKTNIVWILALIIITMMICIGLANQSNTKTETKRLIGTVRSINWHKTITIEGWQDVTLEDWKDRIPSDSKILSCNTQERTDYTNPNFTTHEVCQMVRVSTGSRSGSTRLEKQCHLEVDEPKEYVSYCQYQSKQWEKIGSVSSEGKDLNIKMLPVLLTANQREGLSEGSYSVWFDTSDGIKTFHTENEQLFKQCEIDSQWILDVKLNAPSMLDQIESIQPQPTPRSQHALPTLRPFRP